MSVEIGIEVDFLVDAAVGDLAAHCDVVMEELVKLSGAGCGIIDPAVSLDESARTITLEVVALGESFDDAVAAGDSGLRAAIHAAGGSTSGWLLTKQSQRAELVTS